MKPPKTCIEIRHHLFSFLKNELGPDERARVQRHLDVCPACAKEAGQVSRMLDALDGLFPRQEPPEGALGRLRARIRTSTPVLPWRYRSAFRWAAGSIVFMGGLCLIWLLRINDQVLRGLKQTLQILGVELPWLTEGPVSSFLAPILFIILCSILTLFLSPLALRKKKERSGAPALELKQEKGKN